MEFDKKSKKRKSRHGKKGDKSPPGPNDLIKHYKVNYCYLVFYVATMAANGICVAWTTGGNN